MYAKEFACQEHLLLLPDKEKATLGNVFKFLFTSDISKSDLLHHNLKENKYLHRFSIFVSILIQIFLNDIVTPLKNLGTKIEDFLNHNTQRDSDDYFSILGHVDTRLDLDQKIKHGDKRYYAALTMMAAKLAYENRAVVKTAVSDHWKMEFVDFYNFYNEFQHKSATQAFIFRDQTTNSDTTVVSFRGTSPFVADDWITDFNYSWVKIDQMGKTHTGFMVALGLNKYGHKDEDCLGDFYGYWPKKIKQDPNHPLAYYTIRAKLKEIMETNKNAKFIVTGHSLGGALAILFLAVLFLHGEVELLHRLEGIYTYGQPKVGDEDFGKFMKKNLEKYNVKYYRVVYGYDIVPTVPFDWMTFQHFGSGIHFNCLYQGKIVEKDKAKAARSNYLRMVKGIIETLVNIIVARLIAVWQLIRGLMMGFVVGPDYREGWLLILLRILGILVPSFIDHFPQDYVNSTRLASQDLFTNYPALPY